MTCTTLRHQAGAAVIGKCLVLGVTYATTLRQKAVQLSYERKCLELGMTCTLPCVSFGRLSLDQPVESNPCLSSRHDQAGALFVCHHALPWQEY